MTNESIEIIRHILAARVANADDDTRTTWRSMQTIFEYGVEDNIECLRQFDYLV